MSCDDPPLPYITQYCAKEKAGMEGPCGSYGLTQAAHGPLGALEEGQLGPNQQQPPKLPCRLCRKRERNDMQEGRADMKEVCRRKEQCGDT